MSMIKDLTVDDLEHLIEQTEKKMDDVDDAVRNSLGLRTV